MKPPREGRPSGLSGFVDFIIPTQVEKGKHGEHAVVISPFSGFQRRTPQHIDEFPAAIRDVTKLFMLKQVRFVHAQFF